MNHIEAILSALNTLRVHELRSTDPSSKFKASAYNKAITSIRGLTRPIRHIDDVKGLPGVGPKILAKISEILETGRLCLPLLTFSAVIDDIYTASSKDIIVEKYIGSNIDRTTIIPELMPKKYAKIKKDVIQLKRLKL